ncbi:MAG: hypothetical protein JST38_14535 [Bacteroidetes bacterium]|nr:hypothetical protein [Bacteroidota bacterium]MBS1942084.1 hypothetical protein [Bacteroidota bacterium]
MIPAIRALFPAWLLLAACGIPAPDQGQAPGSAHPQPETETRCYLRVTKNPPVVVDADTFPGTPDSLYVRVDLVGELANGVYNWLPGEKDHITGTFTGSVSDNVITALYTYHAEGMAGQQEVIFRMDPNGLRVATGEMTGNDSLQVFKDKSAVTYSDPVPAVPCP